jgi:hypothetical protein
MRDNMFVQFSAGRPMPIDLNIEHLIRILKVSHPFIVSDRTKISFE